MLKTTGLFILLSFLLVKNTQLLAVDLIKNSTISYFAEQAADETENAEKQNKHLENADENVIDQSLSCLLSLTLFEKKGNFLVQHVTNPYISLPYPPPN